MKNEIKKYGCFVNGVEQKYPNVAPGTPVYANATVVNDIVYVSGMTAQKFEDGSCTTNTMEDQMWVALTKMKQVLEDAGSSLDNVFKTFIMLKDIKDYPVMRATELKFYQENAPELVERPAASTILQAGCLARPEFLVEIECMAVLNK
ncbi:RidA family protein [Emergencia sp.]|uniref:RidA family protein n=1 Tax=Emergencia sp. TaxID=1926557 RepID=UPI003AEFAC81